MRTQTVSELYNRLKDVKFIHVRGTPASGKSTLAGLLYHHISHHDSARKLHWIVGWPKPAVSPLFRQHAKGWKWDDNSVVIIDEAQSTYSDPSLWDGYSNYGNPTSSNAGGTPWTVNRVSLRPDSESSIGLFFTRDEYEDYCSRRFDTFDTTFMDWLFELTCGHIGALEDTLKLLMADDIYRGLGNGEKYTYNNFIHDLDPDAFYNGLLTGSIFSLGLPKPEYLHLHDITSVLRDVIHQGSFTRASTSLEFAEDERCLETCFRKGWVHAISHNDEGTDFIFASPLHEGAVCWMLSRFGGPDGDLNFSDRDILDFYSEVISRFSLSATRTIGAGQIYRTPESHFQHEFHRCSLIVANGSVKVFPEFGTKRRAEFSFPSKNWAVELLRDGDGNDLQEHFSRFRPLGKCTRTLTIDQHILLDFCSAKPVNKLKHDNPNLYHVVITHSTELDTQKCVQVRNS